MFRVGFLTLLGLALPALYAEPPADKAALATKARALLKQYCHRCHGVEFEAPGRNVLDLDTLKSSNEESDAWVVPGKAKESQLFRRFGISMPPKDIRERPSKEDRKIIEQWIEAGAPPFPKVEARPYVSPREIIVAMRDHLQKARMQDRPFLKFFTLTHLHNDPRIPDVDLRYNKAALSKVINSLSWKELIVVPQAVDKHGTVFVVDIRDLDWDRDNLWRAILKVYPYGLRYDEAIGDTVLRDADRELFHLAGRVLSHIRGDWFVSTAARSPLYETLLQLPDHAAKLETKLGVDVYKDFGRNKLKRGAFATSGVSGQNRLVERHDATYGAYWKSYDFKKGGDRSNLIDFPLGPHFRGNDFNAQAFVHDGGEIIFNLPNRLQGYLLVDGKDSRIFEGPIEVVSDKLKTSGTPAIVNGLSCMACHKHGVIEFKDEIRKGNSLAGTAREKVEDLYPDNDTGWRKQLVEDEKRFLDSLDKAIGPFVRVAEDKDRAIKEFPEPVGELARRYRLVDLKLADVALELGIEKPSDLGDKIKGNPKLRELGLGALLDNGAIKRDVWEGVGRTPLFHAIAQELELGTPYRVLK